MVSTNSSGAAPSVVSGNWQTNKRLATVWDRGVKSRPVAMVYGAVVFATDNRKMYRHMASAVALPEGTSVLDIPSGGGVVFLGLRPGKPLRYVAADISDLMLDRARAEADRRGLDFVEFEKADATELPFKDEEFDVVVSYSGLHCVPDPEAAVREWSRVLKPGGAVKGSVVVRGASFLPDRFINLWVKLRILDVVTPVEEVRRWFRDAGLRVVRTETSGAVLYFELEKPKDRKA
ncbi:class I SAM-dependent methyltransferase [Actinomadura rudentiformis]|uniref:Methyltransferase domain-containing protein n=1 Tax=Actinomadura rudentiformis TaxID=359158 RepID=A0A6H9YIR8_9ACTN|nr:class I SAM-dependent methyltransferase [Actinomadura rudentiformis]KAB2342456.1 methyltransferase domain-containing protein [Actinomadura rudentiformis]